MSIRMLDYYQKGLPVQVRQCDIPHAFDEIGVMMAKRLAEAPQDYPAFRRMRLDDQQIENLSAKTALKFQAANQIMIENSHPPLFPNPYDTYKSSLRYFELLYRYHSSGEKTIYSSLNFGKDSESEDILIKIMGCTWEEYVPEEYCPEKKQSKLNLKTTKIK